MSSIGDRLREERERLGMNQSDFAEAAGTTRKSQFNYETNERRPDAEYLAAAAVKGADVQYIVTGHRSDTALTADEREVIALFRAAPLTVKMAAIGALSANQAPSAQGLARQVFQGAVGQAVQGNITNREAVTFNVGQRAKKK